MRSYSSSPKDFAIKRGHYEFLINNSLIDSILTLSPQDFSYRSTEIYSGAVDRVITLSPQDFSYRSTGIYSGAVD